MRKSIAMLFVIVAVLTATLLTGCKDADLEKAQQLIGNNQVELAKPLVEKSITNHPDKAEAYLVQGECRLKSPSESHTQMEAIESFKSAVKLDDSSEMKAKIFKLLMSNQSEEGIYFLQEIDKDKEFMKNRDYAYAFLVAPGPEGSSEFVKLFKGDKEAPKVLRDEARYWLTKSIEISVDSDGKALLAARDYRNKGMEIFDWLRKSYKDSREAEDEFCREFKKCNLYAMDIPIDNKWYVFREAKKGYVSFYFDEKAEMHGVVGFQGTQAELIEACNHLFPGEFSHRYDYTGPKVWLAYSYQDRKLESDEEVWFRVGEPGLVHDGESARIVITVDR